jgi:hypothetical protein
MLMQRLLLPAGIEAANNRELEYLENNTKLYITAE